MLDYITKKAFNSWAASYEEDVIKRLKKRGYSYDKLSNFILEYIEDNNDILELGVGTGLVGYNLKNKKINLKIDGVDISDKMLEIAKDKNVYETLYNISIPPIKLENNKLYDVIYTCFMLHSIKNIDLLLQDIKSLLKKNGKVILVDLFNQKDSNFYSIVKDYIISLPYERGAPTFYKTTSNAVKIFKKHGFQTIYSNCLDNMKNYDNIVGKRQHWILVFTNEK